MSRKQGGTTTADNLAWCCVFCNRYKGSDIAALDPRTGNLVPLFHPHRHRWADHFHISGGILEPLTPQGEATARLLRFNEAQRVVERVLLQTAGLYPRE